MKHPFNESLVAASLLLSLLLLSACSSTRNLQNNPATSATLWMQNAAEYKALTTSIYQTASSRLDKALNNPAETAVLHNHNKNYQNLPPAIILDVDETVLNNSAFEARLIKQHADYSAQKWNKWVREEKADPIAGALAFTQKAARKDITVFYITNRDASLEKPTYQNLKKLGFPLKDSLDVLLLNKERPGWTSSKANRRKYVAKNYRILMLFGDNLNDFLPATNISHQRRQQLVKKYRKRWGRQWFILPNPTYGSWQKALYNFDDSLSPQQRQKKKREMLHTKN